MFNFYVVSYDLHLVKDYPKIQKAIDNLAEDWVKPLESFYIIKTNLDAVSVRSALVKSTDNDDSVFVIKADIKEWACYGIDQDLLDRLKEWL